MRSPTFWPRLDYESSKETIDTLHLWLQIIGKIRMNQTPWINHAWGTTLYVNARGFTTGLIPDNPVPYEICVDFIDHRVAVNLADGSAGGFDLVPMSVKNFYHQLLDLLKALGVDASISTMPNEILEPIDFREDDVHRSYDMDVAANLWLAFLNSHRVFTKFRSDFYGKNSPVHLFWGSFDLAVTRFSGRPAPEHPAGIPHLPDRIAKEAYSQEVISAGFWPGTGLGYPAFYAYAYPSPDDFKDAKLLPDEVFFSEDFGEFILPYDVVQASEDPDKLLLSFLNSSYDAAAELLGWDFNSLKTLEDFN